MDIFERLGLEVKPLINVAGATTRCGGALMEPEIVEAMDEVARYSVRLDELQAAASKVIAKMTHAEAGIVTCGASAALTLGTAACIAGFDVARMNRLPDTTGIPNEVIMPWHQISGYDHAIQVPGARIIGVGIPHDTTPPHEVFITSKWDIQAAISEKTVAIAYAARVGSHPPLEDVIEIGKKYNIPVMVDAAAQAPPVEGLYKFIDMGADLVCFSGGKGIRGPQASGILCGRRDLIGSALLQTLDMAGEGFDEWDPPASIIPKEKLKGKPIHGVGRGMKVSKEAVVGLIAALEKFTGEGFVKKAEHLRKLLRGIESRIKGIAGVKTEMSEQYAGGYPTLEIMIDEKVAGRSAAEISRRLMDGKPRVSIRDKYVRKGILTINSMNLDEDTAKAVGECLYVAIAK